MKPSCLGQALGFIKLVAGLGGGAILIWVLWETTYPLLNEANQHTNPGDSGAVANDWIRVAAENMPVAFLGLAFFGFIALAVFQREVR